MEKTVSISFNKNELKEVRRALKYYFKIMKKTVLFYYTEELLTQAKEIERMVLVFSYLKENEKTKIKESEFNLLEMAINIYLLYLEHMQKKDEKRIKIFNDLINFRAREAL